MRGVFSHTLICCWIFSADADQLVLCTSADKTLLDILVMSKQREWKGCKLSTRGLSLSRVSFALLSSFSSLSSSELSSATKAMKRIENTVYGLQWLEWRRRNRKNAKKRKIEKRHLRHRHNIIYKYSSPFYLDYKHYNKTFLHDRHTQVTKLTILIVNLVVNLSTRQNDLKGHSSER